MQIWDKKYETMPTKELEQLQLERLQTTLYRILRNDVTFYRKRLDEIGFELNDIESLSDIQKLPFTTRQDLKNSYPYDMFAVPIREVVRIHEASGDMGIVGYTKNDVINWSNLVARMLYSAGITEDDKIQITLPYGLFPGAFGYHYGAELIGASVIPTSTANTEKQIMIMEDYLTTVIILTPSYALRLIHDLKKLKKDFNRLQLKLAVLGAEPWNKSLRAEIEGGLKVTTCFNYGIASVFGPGVATECREKDGLHFFMDHFIAEIIHPSSGAPLPMGEEGELVITTITREAFPIIRFRTGDITRLYFDKKPCPCGRTHPKIEPVKKRNDDLIVFRGINIYPDHIEKILTDIEGVKPKFRIVLNREDGEDEMSAEIEISENVFFDEMKIQKKFIENIENIFIRRLGAKIHVKLVEVNTIDSREPLIIDNRK